MIIAQYYQVGTGLWLTMFKECQNVHHHNHSRPRLVKACTVHPLVQCKQFIHDYVAAYGKPHCRLE